jgi:hypothetical protein
VDTLGHLLALRVIRVDEQDRAQIEEPTRSVQEATRESVELAYVDRATPAKRLPGQPKLAASVWRWSGTPGPRRASSCWRAGGWWSAPSCGRRGFAGSPRTTRGCPQSVAGLRFGAFACLFLHRAIAAPVSGP